MSKNNINKYVEEDYFSDDNVEEEIINDYPPEEEEDEEDMDPEEKRLFWEAMMKRTSNFNVEEYSRDSAKEKQKNKKKEKENKQSKKKQGMSLIEFNTKLEEEAKAKQPKKFVSKRVEEKKKINGVEEQKFKRCFNPRLPPYNWVNKQKQETHTVDLSNKEQFPSL